MNYFYKLLKNKETIDKCSTHSFRVFIKKLRTINFKENDILVHIKFTYKEKSTNEGDYRNRHDLFQAVKAFNEGK